LSKIEEVIQAGGTVIEALPATQFRVELESGHKIIAYLCSKMRRFYIRVLLGDWVTVEMSPYDLEKAGLPIDTRCNLNPDHGISTVTLYEWIS